MFNKNLKYLRDKYNIGQSDLAHKLGKGNSTISNWESGTNIPKVSIISEIANIFNVTISDLMNVDLQNLDESENFSKLNKIAVFSKVMEEQSIYDVDNLENYISIPNLKTNTFALKISDDSMDKQFKENDLIVIQKDAKINFGDIGVVVIDNSETIVRRIKYDNQKIILLPESNNESYLPLFFNSKNEITIIGKVIGAYIYY